MAQDLILDDNWADADMDNPEWKDEAAIVVPAEGVETRLDPMQRRLEEAKAAGPPFCVFLGNLPFSISEQEIREEFAEIEFSQVKILGQGRDSDRKFVVFAYMNKYEYLVKALEHDGQSVGGRTMRVDVAESKPAKGAKGPKRDERRKKEDVPRRKPDSSFSKSGSGDARKFDEPRRPVAVKIAPAPEKSAWTKPLAPEKPAPVAAEPSARTKPYHAASASRSEEKKDPAEPKLSIQEMLKVDVPKRSTPRSDPFAGAKPREAVLEKTKHEGAASPTTEPSESKSDAPVASEKKFTSRPRGERGERGGRGRGRPGDAPRGKSGSGRRDAKPESKSEFTTKPVTSKSGKSGPKPPKDTSKSTEAVTSTNVFDILQSD